MRTLLLVAGFAAIAVGLLWIGQGSGYINWPASSFMIGRSNWALWGVLLATAGAVVITLSRR